MCVWYACICMCVFVCICMYMCVCAWICMHVICFIMHSWCYVWLESDETFNWLTVVFLQGSILGSLLYLIYVNDIGNSCQCNILSFADDTTLHVSQSNINTLFFIAHEQLKTYWLGSVPTSYVSMKVKLNT